MKKSFQELIDTHETPILVDFHALWCAPCKVMNPVIQSIAQQYAGKLKVIKIDVDNNPQVANRYQVRGVPTFMLFHQGKVLWQQSGAIPPAEFQKILSKFIQ